ncbi:MAG: insulinase family protein [Candidatus Aminicenantes bacterium]|nr:insulinase family protein [Candidatus Aminicenantes bacterium]
MRRAGVVAVCVLLAAAPGMRGVETPASDFFTLANGLKVFLLESHNLPLFHAVVGVKAGSRNETAATSGLTHILEHVILFRGSRTRTADEINRDVRRNGGHFNAHTGQDFTLFEMTLPAGGADFALQNLADIVFDLRVDREGLDAERAVILEELSNSEDDPLRSALAAVYQNLFEGHAYSLPIAGTREGVLRITAEQLEAFYRSYYTPSNAALAVVGDFDLVAVKGKIREIFGSLPRSEAPSQSCDPPPRLRRDQEITLEMDVSQPLCLLGFSAPDCNHPDRFAVELLAEILGRGVNPLLGAALRSERRLVESVSMLYYAHELAGALIVILRLDPKQGKAGGRRALSFLRSSRRLNFSPEDVYGMERGNVFDYLESAKNQIRFSSEKSREKGMSLAVLLARQMLLSRNASSEGFLNEIEKIKSFDLRRAAAKYFSSGKTVAVYVIPSNPERRR